MLAGGFPIFAHVCGLKVQDDVEVGGGKTSQSRGFRLAHKASEEL